MHKYIQGNPFLHMLEKTHIVIFVVALLSLTILLQQFPPKINWGVVMNRKKKPQRLKSKRSMEPCCRPSDANKANEWASVCDFGDSASRDLFFDDLDILQQSLPNVAILPISSRFQVDEALDFFWWGDVTYNFWADSTHAQDVKFIYWINFSYHKVVPMNEADYFFLPAFQRERPKDDWWIDLDADLHWIFEGSKVPGLQLDKTFMASTQVFSPNQYLSPWSRYASDIRQLRVDNDYSGNARDIYVPYVIRRHEWQPRIYTAPSLGRRSLFIAAACREASGGLEISRLWRSKVLTMWGNISDSVISADMSEEQFRDAYSQSDFCLILPGDTSSTAKLYKAIFAGCIPVIFVSFHDQLPFVNLIDWSLFSVVVTKDVINHNPAMDELLQLLRDLRDQPEMLGHYKLALSYAAFLFDYNKIDWPSVYHLTLLQMRLEDRRCSGSGGDVTASSPLSRYLCAGGKKSRQRTTTRSAMRGSSRNHTLGGFLGGLSFHNAGERAEAKALLRGKHAPAVKLQIHKQASTDKRDKDKETTIGP